jgi:hypothetical protein
MTALTLTRVGGPTMPIEADGFRLVTDPTFDAPGEYQLSYVTLTKTYSDNLDHSGRAFAAMAPRVFTTVAGAARLGGPAEGLRLWDGWAHLTQDGADLEQAFTALGLRSRLQMLKPGVAVPIDLAK